jgi:DNA-binding protein H-NS
MRKPDLETMSFDELWQLHEELSQILAERITVEKNALEERLAQLNPKDPIQSTSDNSTSSTGAFGKPPRRSYPAVAPKYANPASPGETWSGRGKRPKWLVQALQTGHSLDEFEIERFAKHSDDLLP